VRAVSLLRSPPAKSCPQPGKVLRTRRKVGNRERFDALLRQLLERA
jgi:hypothetical protein